MQPLERPAPPGGGKGLVRMRERPAQERDRLIVFLFGHLAQPLGTL